MLRREDLPMRYGVYVPNLDEFVDARRFGELARRAEEAGWNGFFVWDHVVFPHGGRTRWPIRGYCSPSLPWPPSGSGSGRC
jgi:alkanesulfonate monooxygenase SsuD/methylene tetrahydromethanopterin reductase-like flavin-dependent oxidoreductase (luciferase family)